jgi:selenium-binding protein 1
MTTWKPDPTFYPSPRLAMRGPRETLGYVAILNVDGTKPDAIGVVGLDPQSRSYGKLIGRTDMRELGDELHHFGWNACSSALCPYAPHPHVERRYLLVPGLRSSRIYVLDTKPDPVSPQIVKVIEPREVFERSGYSRPHTLHCGPEGIFASALGTPEGEAPGGVFLLDHDSFDVLGRWEVDRGPQQLAYDFAWHLGYDVQITSEWGTPNMIENGLVPELLLGSKYGHQLHFWDLKRRRHVQAIDLGPEHQLVLELRPARDPTKPYGFVGVVVSLEDLSASIWLWHQTESAWAARKVITIPAEAANPDELPPLLKGFKAVPPLLTDINLSLDDRFLYASCWGTGELRQYDVSDPFAPRFVGSARIGGIVRRTPHPATGPVDGGPQMVEVSRDGRRVYFTNSLYRAWDSQFYPDGISGWMVKCDVGASGGLTLDPEFFVPFEPGFRPHQVRLQGGDSSSDTYCYP